MAVSAFLVIWLAFLFGLAPVFADAETKAARNAVKIRHFWPGSEELQLEFVSDQVADLISRANQVRVVRKE